LYVEWFFLWITEENVFQQNSQPYEITLNVIDIKGGKKGK
jgi:hypothetical protein